MKRFILASIISILFLNNNKAEGQIKATNEFVKTLFLSFKNDDEKKFISIFPSSENMKKMLLKMINTDTTFRADSSSDENILGELLKITDTSLGKEFSKEFKKIKERAKQKQVDWNTAELTSFETDTTVSDFLGSKELKGKLYINSGGKQFFILFDEVIWSEEDNGWYGVDIKKIGVRGIDEEKIQDEWDEEPTNSLDSLSFLTDTTFNSQVRKPESAKSDKNTTIKKPVKNKPSSKTKTEAKKQD